MPAVTDPRWPDREQAQEFVEMVRAAPPAAYVCFEYHDGSTKLTAKALRKATEWLVDSIQVLLAVDLDDRVVIASGALSAIDDATADMLIDRGLSDFFREMAKAYPDQVAMVEIDRKGGITFDPGFRPE